MWKEIYINIYTSKSTFRRTMKWILSPQFSLYACSKKYEVIFVVSSFNSSSFHQSPRIFKKSKFFFLKETQNRTLILNHTLACLHKLQSLSVQWEMKKIIDHIFFYTFTNKQNHCSYISTIFEKKKKVFF